MGERARYPLRAVVIDRGAPLDPATAFKPLGVARATKHRSLREAGRSLRKMIRENIGRNPVCVVLALDHKTTWCCNEALAREDNPRPADDILREAADFARAVLRNQAV